MSNLSEKREALILAIIGGALGEVEALLAQDPAAALDSGWEESPLVAAVRAGSTGAVKALLPYLFGANKDKERALVLAAELGRTGCAELLIPATRPDEHAGEMRQIELAFDNWVDPRPPVENGLTPLCVAAGFGSLDCLRLLLAASTPTLEHASHALGWAAQGGKVDCARALIPFSDPKLWDSGALQRAAAAGSHECVELLIPLSCPEDGEARALCLAADNGHPDCVRLLLPTSGSGDGVGKALIFAARMECEESLRLILAAHPEAANFVGWGGFTALMCAVMIGSEACARILAPLSDLEMRSSGGERAQDIADSNHREERHPEIAAYLKELSLSREEARILGVASGQGGGKLVGRRL